jgi:hypothetical protein
MKKALAVMALFVAGTLAFADSTAGTTVPNPLTATLAANGWASVGADLDTGTGGIKNGSEAKVSFTILNGLNDKGQSVGGYISVNEIRIWFDGSTGGNLALSIGELTAKVLLGDLYIKLRANTDASIDYLADLDNDNGASTIALDDAFYVYSGLYGATETEWALGNVGALPLLSGATGVEVGYTVPGPLAIVGQVASAKSGWTDKPNQDWEGKVEVSLLAVEKLTAIVGFGINSDIDSAKGVGAKVGYDAGVVNVWGAIDYNLPSAGDSTYVAVAGATLPVVDGVKIVAVYQYDATSLVNDPTSDVQITANLVTGKAIGPIGLQVGAQLLDLTAIVDNDLVFFAKAALDAGSGITVWGKTSYDTTSSEDGAIFIKAGIDAAILPLTTFSVEWDSNDQVAGYGASEGKLGQLFVTAKVTY